MTQPYTTTGDNGGLKPQPWNIAIDNCSNGKKEYVPSCHQHLENGEETHIHHVVPKKDGGTDDLVNLWLVHLICHRQIHSSSPPLEVRRLLEPSTG